MRRPDTFATDGAIVNLSSSLAGRTVQGFGAHTASEAATDVLTRPLADELLDRGITVNAIAMDFDGPCEPQRIAQIVAYLIVREANKLTGQIIGVGRQRGASTRGELVTRRRDDAATRNSTRGRPGATSANRVERRVQQS